MKQYNVTITLKKGYCDKKFTDIHEAISFAESYVRLVGEDDVQYIRIDPEETEEEAQWTYSKPYKKYQRANAKLVSYHTPPQLLK